jgi:hypothetical protein
MYALNFPRFFVMMVCIVFLFKGIAADAQIEPNLSLADNVGDDAVDNFGDDVGDNVGGVVGESKATRCIMTSKPRKDCAVGVMQRAGASCAFNKRCSIRCKGMVGCRVNCRCIAA